MKILNPKLLKKRGLVLFSLMMVLVFLTSGTAFAAADKGLEDPGLGAAGTLGPLGVTALALGTVAAVAIVAESMTDSSSTTTHHTTAHH